MPRADDPVGVPDSIKIVERQKAAEESGEWVSRDDVQVEQDGRASFCGALSIQEMRSVFF